SRPRRQPAGAVTDRLRRGRERTSTDPTDERRCECLGALCYNPRTAPAFAGVFFITGRSKATCVGKTSLKTVSECSFRTPKLRFFGCLCLVLPASPTLFKRPVNPGPPITRATTEDRLWPRTSLWQPCTNSFPCRTPSSCASPC